MLNWNQDSRQEGRKVETVVKFLRYPYNLDTAV